MKKAMVRMPVPEDFERGLPIAAIVDEYLATGRNKVEAWVGSRMTDVDDRAPFHMSGGVCMRDEMLKAIGARAVPMPGIAYRRFAIGNLVENVLEQACLKKGILVDAQTRLWRDWAMRSGKGHKYTALRPGVDRLDLSECLVVGTLDAVVCWNPAWASIAGTIPRERWSDKGTMFFLVDWKSCHSKKLDWVDREIDKGYALQVAGYAMTYVEQYDKVIDGVRLIYVDKDALRIKQVGIDMVEWGPQAMDRFRGQRAAMIEYEMSEKIPNELPRDSEGTLHWKCDPRYCGWAAACDAHGTFRCPGVAASFKDALEKMKPDMKADIEATFALGAKLYEGGE